MTGTRVSAHPVATPSPRVNWNDRGLRANDVSVGDVVCVPAAVGDGIDDRQDAGCIPDVRTVFKTCVKKMIHKVTSILHPIRLARFRAR